MIFLILLKIAIVSFCLGCSSESAEKSDEFDGGRFSQQNKAEAFLELDLVLRTQLGFRNKGFIRKFSNVRFRDNRFFVLDGATSDIHVFSRQAAYLKTIKSAFEEDNYTGYPGFTFGPDGHFFIYSAKYKDSKVIEADSTGRTLRIYSPHLGENDKNAEISSPGLVVIKTNAGKRVFTKSFQWMPLDRLLDSTLTIASFGENGHLTRIFSPYHPDYVKYNLISWRDIDLAAYDSRIYSLQRALPYIFVYDLNGTLQYQFGRFGAFHRPIIEEPDIMGSVSAQIDFWRKQTTYSHIRIIRIDGEEAPLVAVSYYNPALKAVPGLKHYQELHDNYLQLYRLSGEPYHPDIKLPGRFHDFTEDGHLLILENLLPAELTVGLYKVRYISSRE